MPQTSRERTILIVGAGPTGLVLALQLTRRGIPIRIVDKANGPGHASRAMAVQARTLEFYQQLGFADEIVAAGIVVETMHVRQEGRDAATVSLKGIGEGLSPFPFALSYPQDDHEHFLKAKLEAEGVEIEYGTELAGFDEHEAGVHARLRKGGAEEPLECAYLCGCDGAHSAVRQGLAVDFPGGTYEQLFFVVDARVDGGFEADGSLNLGPDKFVFRLPVRSTGAQRLIGVVPSEGVPEKPTFEDVRADTERLVGRRIDQVNWFSTYHVHHRVAAHFKVGRCFLAGDAGHVHSPAGGQGMNTGIGDAVNLAWKLADVVRGRAPATLLDTYETERIAFARKLVATTDRAFQAMVGRGGSGRLLRSQILPRLMPILARFEAVRRLLFLTASQTRVKYRDSALSAGVAGRVHGGDRLPWLRSGPDNYAPLRSLDWQVHVYGRPHGPFAAKTAEAGLPLHAFDWRDFAGRAGFKRDAAYVIRPDGYVALALPDQDPVALRIYLERQGLVLAPDTISAAA